jgi:hypothetical protein
MEWLHIKDDIYAVVDDEDYNALVEYNWRLNSGYAIRNQNKKRIPMSHHIMNPPEGMTVDHINGHRLDNRKENLRVCTKQQNLQNRIMRRGTSKYKGVRWNKLRKKWQAALVVECDTEEYAAKMYNELARLAYGDYAKLNDV